MKNLGVKVWMGSGLFALTTRVRIRIRIRIGIRAKDKDKDQVESY